jgi:hypothetical protein
MSSATDGSARDGRANQPADHGGCIVSQDVLIERLFGLLVCGDRAGTEQLVEDALGHGLTPAELADGAYMPLIRTINALHRAKQLTNLAHGYATGILDTLLDEAQRRGSAEMPPPPPSPPAPFRGSFAHRLRPPHWGQLDSHSAGSGAREDLDASRPTGASRRAQFVSFSLTDRVLTARLAGPSIGARETPIVNTEINDLLSTLGPRLKRLVLDLSDVQRMSSMALGMCLDVRSRARTLGIKTAAVGMSHDMAKVLRRLKLADGPRPARMVGALRNAFAS